MENKDDIFRTTAWYRKEIALTERFRDRARCKLLVLQMKGASGEDQRSARREIEMCEKRFNYFTERFHQALSLENLDRGAADEQPPAKDL